MDAGSDSVEEERSRIERAYRRRAANSQRDLYDPDRPEVKIQIEQLEAALERLLERLSPRGIEDLRFLDVGCGTGKYLRMLIALGAQPGHLVGTELLKDRLETARELTVDGPVWHLGTLDNLDGAAMFDFVSTFTVLSSILDDTLRQTLADQMWRRTRVGGACVVYDFRYNNPANPDVRKVTRTELESLFPRGQTEWSTTTLAPPISRPVAKLSPWLVRGLGSVPPLRSHFFFTAWKTS